MSAKLYVVEQEGYNDGHPYFVARYALLHNARQSLEDHRRSNPKVRYRLIEIKEDF